MDEIRKKAKEDYMKGMKYKDICDKYNLSMNTLKSWVSRYKWAAERKNKNKKGAHKKKRGAPKGNKNATGNKGGSAPPGNINAIKHGAYQSLYADMLSNEEKILFNMILPSTNIDDEIKLLRLKIARLLNREVTFFYSPFGDKVEKELSEEERIDGINACMEQLRRLIEAKAKIATDIEKIELEKEKFEFQKYRTDVELQLKKDRGEIERAKVFGAGEGDEDQEGIDSFIKATEMSKRELKALFKDDDNEDIQEEKED